MFLDKRDNSGQLLGFAISPTAYSLSDICLTHIKKNKDLFTLLYTIFPENLIDLYFRKLFFELSFKTACQIVLNKKNIYSDLPYLDVIQKSDKFNKYIFIKIRKKESKIKFLRNLIIYNLEKFISINDMIFNLYFKIFGKSEKIKKTKIAVNFIEGVSKDKRNDFFWYDKNVFDHEVVTYIESKDRVKKLYNSKKDLNKILKAEKIEQLTLINPLYFQINKKIKSIKDKINNINFNKEDYFLKQHIKIMLTKIQFWYFFFKENNIKIHINAEESGQANIARQLALKLYDGCSIGKIKSYPTNIREDYLGYFPNDICFAWGVESVNRLKNTNNCIKHYVITGDPYPKIEVTKKIDFEKKIQKLKNNGKKYFIMILDSIYSYNKDLFWHFIYHEKMESFFKNFLQLQTENPEIGLIIKSKKKDNLKNLGEVFKEIKGLNHKNECILIDENNAPTTHYSNQADLIVSFSTYIQGALIQALVKDPNKRGLMFDDTNLSILEKKIYEYGKDKIIFNNLNKMNTKILDLIKNKNRDPELGKWKNLNEHDPFGDYRGGQRIGMFIKTLLENFNKKFNSNESMLNSLKKYSSLYGENKIYEK